MGKAFGLPTISAANVTQLAEMVAGDTDYSRFIGGLREYQGRYGQGRYGVVSVMK